MSAREGHDAMALQREQVMMLLGTVTNPDNFNQNLSCQGHNNFNSSSSDSPICKDHSRKAFHELENDAEETPYKSESIPCTSKNEMEIEEQMNDFEPAYSINIEVENNFSKKLNEAQKETLNKSPQCPQVSSEFQCKSSYAESTHSFQLTNDKKQENNNSQGETAHLSEHLADIMKRAHMYTQQRLQQMTASSGAGEVSNEAEMSSNVNSFAVGNGLSHPASVLHNMWEYPAGNGLSENTALLNLRKPGLLHDYSHLFTHADEWTKGCKWSPDGKLLMVLSSNQKFSIIEPWLEELAAQGTNEGLQETLLTITEGELVYDYQWYPFMSTADPSTNCFVCCCRGLPIHLWDAGRGTLVGSYQPYNHLDELAPAYSLGFSGDGSQLVCGFKKIIRVFDTARPGRKCRSLCAKKQNGIISCFNYHPHLHHVMAAGSYLGSVGLYSHNTGRAFCVLMGHAGGVTQIEFSSDGYRLYSGARMDDELLCWDVRQMGRVLHSYKRLVRSNQRVAFQLTTSGQTAVLVSGSTDGRVMSWCEEDYLNSDRPRTPDHCFQAHDDCVNGVSIHPHASLLATSSGQRHPSPHPDDRKSRRVQPPPPSVRLWTLAEKDPLRS